jgi:hypothetical protein
VLFNTARWAVLQASGGLVEGSPSVAVGWWPLRLTIEHYWATWLIQSPGGRRFILYDKWSAVIGRSDKPGCRAVFTNYFTVAVLGDRTPVDLRRLCSFDAGRVRAMRVGMSVNMIIFRIGDRVDEPN